MTVRKRQRRKEPTRKTYLTAILKRARKLVSAFTRKRTSKTKQVLVTLHDDIVDELDHLSEQTDQTRSSVIEDMVVDVLADEERLDNLFGEEEEMEEDEEEGEEG